MSKCTKQMVEDLQLTEAARSQGFPFLCSKALDPMGLQLCYVINPGTFRIIQLSNLIVPITSQEQINSSPSQCSNAAPLQSPPPSPRPAKRSHPLGQVNPISLSNIYAALVCPRSFEAFSSQLLDYQAKASQQQKTAIQASVLDANCGCDE
ncbi:hypothetical protein RhiXN_11295 [Rhizoctonia solani]|uniref:Uncharacterized protein n=1 Tax=Rhizoctonia solani TaxID=456999 RepID=A0A8H8P5W3_9AGAM|nr:uncharacterized protein RhiXN_11295 [Rhizoctonia solani]QRW24383.1 hypothetical protein RhiXN_11295 [Rhizoctonia solani]